MKMREAIEADCERILEIRNQPHVRKNSFDDAVIPVTEHEPWFLKSLKNPARKLYVTLDHLESVIGVIRADIRLSHRRQVIAAEMSYFLDLEYCGLGLGTLMLQNGEIKAKEYDNRIEEYVAHTFAFNTASNGLLSKSGYQIINVDEGKMTWLKKGRK